MQGPIFLETEVDKYDIGLYINKVDTMSDDVWHPLPHFVYPTTNGRRFNSDWFKIFVGGLCYSKYFDGEFCLACVLFGKFCNTKSKLQQLYVKPLNAWPSAYGKLKYHFGIKETSGVKAESE